jgi:hypothetical protein
MKGNIGKILEFIGYTILIYVCYISSGVYHEKMYQSIDLASNTSIPQKQIQKENISMPLFPSLSSRK